MLKAGKKLQGYFANATLQNAALRCGAAGRGCGGWVGRRPADHRTVPTPSADSETRVNREPNRDCRYYIYTARYSEHLLQHSSLLCSRLTRTQLPLVVLVGCSSWELGWEPTIFAISCWVATLSTLSRRNNTSSLRLQTHLTTRYFPPHISQLNFQVSPVFVLI